MGKVRKVKDSAKLAYYVTKQIKLFSWNHRIFSETDSDQQTFLSNCPGPDQRRVLEYRNKRLQTHLPKYSLMRDRDLECKTFKTKGKRLH